MDEAGRLAVSERSNGAWPVQRLKLCLDVGDGVGSHDWACTDVRGIGGAWHACASAAKTCIVEIMLAVCSSHSSSAPDYVLFIIGCTLSQSTVRGGCQWVVDAKPPQRASLSTNSLGTARCRWWKDAYLQSREIA